MYILNTYKLEVWFKTKNNVLPNRCFFLINVKEEKMLTPIQSVWK